MAKLRQRPLGIGIGATWRVMAMATAAASVVLGLWGLCGARAASGDDGAQVTVFAILAKPGSKVVDSKLVSIETQLNQLLPHHGFKLLDAQSKLLVPGESVVCDLGQGYTAETSLVQPWPHIEDPDLLGAVVGVLAAQLKRPLGKVHFRCELFLNQALQFSANVKVPLNQLFFCERPFLDDGTKLLIGIGAR